MKLTGHIDLPSREEVLRQIRDLRSGTLSREEISKWAMEFVIADQEKGLEPRITDWAVWESLKTLSGADLHGGDRPYLYGDEDFDAWERELQVAP